VFFQLQKETYELMLIKELKDGLTLTMDDWIIKLLMTHWKCKCLINNKYVKYLKWPVYSLMSNCLTRNK